jgi:hypothetical protein
MLEIGVPRRSRPFSAVSPLSGSTLETWVFDRSSVCRLRFPISGAAFDSALSSNPDVTARASISEFVIMPKLLN